MLDEASSVFAVGLSTGSISVILACATICGLLSQRNAHLSDVSRKISDEYHNIEEFLMQNPKSIIFDKKKVRIDILQRQYTIFISRYKNTAFALRVTVLSIWIFVISDWLALVEKKIAGAMYVAEILSIIGIVVFSIGLYYIQREFRDGSKTLKLNGKEIIRRNLVE